ncbi:Possible two-component regulator [hydrothermal vent metagenome]|uniref:Possible two-component regulator n=1 Tax=hydrothermal vent metagenome TaxID=652676 RepID=A0A1W1BSC9_9ZZZZ
MKILIVENEVYLAQSIVTKLTELGHTCEMCTSTRDALKYKNFDVVLLSTSLNTTDLTPVVEHFRDSIVILMVSYISNDTVSKPLSAGAKDYIVKPFMIEELVRKIDHHQDYEYLKQYAKMIDRYLDYNFQEAETTFDYESFSLPLFLYSSIQKSADAFAYHFSKRRDEPFYFIDLSLANSLNELQNIKEPQLIYAINYQSLKKSEKRELLEIIKDRSIIISSTEKYEEIPYKIVEISNQNSILTHGEILPIEDYVKYIMINYQHKYPDTELSKKLGISRKSLWEKRKKYDIIKKK